MKYRVATKNDITYIHSIVEHTIRTFYPKYYPAEVVDCFCNLHSLEAIIEDVENEMEL